MYIYKQMLIDEKGVKESKMKKNIEYISDISQISQLPSEERKVLEKVVQKFPFKVNTYYLSLINWEDKKDPIRRIIIPSLEEIEDEKWGKIDPSNEAHFTVAPGLEHKYRETVLFLLSDLCGGRCRYCFRKRLFMEERKEEILKDYLPAFQYIKTHPEINNVLLTGGDPLRLSSKALEEILAELREIDTVQTIRIGTRMPVFNPYRVIDDPMLGRVLKKFCTPEKKIYFMLHFSHPNEITEEAVKAVNILFKSGAILCNQTPLLRGVNDDPEVLAELFNRLSFIGVCPYYVFQCRPASGNKPYAVPIVEAYQIFEKAKKDISGLSKRVRYTMSHATGKIEIIGLDDHFIYMKRQRSPESEKNGTFIKALRNENGYWFDDFEVVSETSV